jgi:hypothetical protein
MSEDDPVQKKKEMYGDGGNENQLTIWARRILISLLALALVALLLWFVLLAPQANQISDLQGQLDASQDRVATLEAQVADLEDVRPQREVLSLLTDANTARFELSRNHDEEAAAALLNTERTLTQLGTELDEEFSDTITTLQERLDLAKEDMQADHSFAALSDLEVFVNILLQLQRSLITP